jgi:copper chaperone CopZ
MPWYAAVGHLAPRPSFCLQGDSTIATMATGAEVVAIGTFINPTEDVITLRVEEYLSGTPCAIAPARKYRIIASRTIEVPIKGMDCASCANHVQEAIAALPGVEWVNVLLAAEKAVVRFDTKRVDLSTVRKAVETAGYTVPIQATPQQNRSHGGIQTIEVLVKGRDDLRRNHLE